MMTSSALVVLKDSGRSRPAYCRPKLRRMFRFGFRRRRATKTYQVTVFDGSTLTFELEAQVTGEELLTRSLEAVRATGDSDYFGLASYEGNFVKWIVLSKPLKKQLNGKPPFLLHLRLQVYPMDYHSLTQPSTRHLLFLQLRRDLMENRFSCADDQLVWLVGLAVQADVGDYSPSTCGPRYLSEIDFMPRLTNQLEEKIHQQHRMNRGKPSVACQEEFLGLAQLEAAYGIISYQVQDASRNPVTVTVAPAGVRVLRGMMETNHYAWHTILKISHKGRRLTLNISSSTPTPVNMQFTCLSSQMAANMTYYIARLQAYYCASYLQKPTRLQRFFTSRRSVRVWKPLTSTARPQSVTAPASNPLQRRSFAGEVDPEHAAAFNHTSPTRQNFISRPLRSSLTTTTEYSSYPLTTTTHAEVEVKWGPSHAHTDSWSSRHSQMEPPLHPRQESAISQRSHRSSLGAAEPLLLSTHEEPPLHPRQSSIASQHSHRSSPPPNPELAVRHQHSSSRLSRDSHDLQSSATSTTGHVTVGHTPNHYSNPSPNPQAHSTPINTQYQETMNGLTREPVFELEPSQNPSRYPHREDWQLRSPTTKPPHPVPDHTHSQPYPGLAHHGQRWQERGPPSGREHAPLPAPLLHHGMEHSRHPPYRAEHPLSGMEYSRHPPHRAEHPLSGMEHSRHPPHRAEHPLSGMEHSRHPPHRAEHSRYPPASREPMHYGLGAGHYGLKSMSDTALRWPYRDTEAAIPDFIPEEGGGQVPPSQHSHSERPSSPTVAPSLTMSEFPQPKSSTFPREGDSSLSQPDPHAENMDSVVDFLDEALGVLDEEEAQKKEREKQRVQKPWKPQHRGRFRLSLQESSYYDHRLFNSYRHFNRARAFHGSKHSSSTTHIDAATDTNIETVASMQLQESLVELSQTSDTAIDPHIRSFVFEGSQTECGGATEL